MNLRPLRLALAAATAVALLAACSPVAEEVAKDAAPPDEAAAPAAAAPAPPRAIVNRRPAPAPSAPSTGEYKYINERGQVQVAARLEDIPESQRSTASIFERANPPERPSGARDDVREASNAEVTIFSTRSCGYCRAAMAYFEKQGIPYENRDVEADAEAGEEYLELTGGRRGVPVIVVGEKWMQGWNQEHFDQLLASAR